jgi:uncharacterized membrane protein (DUF485 family)
MDNANPATAEPPRVTPAAPAYTPEMLAAAQRMTLERLRFAIPAVLVSLGAYVAIAAVTGFTTVLNHKVHGELSWTLFLMMLLVPLVWGLTLAYRRQADRWDALAASLRSETGVAQEEGR